MKHHRSSSMIAASTALLACFGASRAPAQTVPQIFEKNCISCHGAAQMSGLDLRQRETLIRGGKRGPAIVPGEPDQSLLLKAIKHEGDLKMPPGKQALPASDIETIRAWIADGAKWDAMPASNRSQSSWWAFRKPVAAAVP